MKVLVVDPDGTLLPEVHPPISTHFGVEVYSASDPLTAIEHAKALSPLSLLITDAYLEGMDGISLSTAIRAIHPNVHTLYISKYDLTPLAQQFKVELFMHRPVIPEHLLGIIEPIFQSLPPLPEPLHEGKSLGPFHLLRSIEQKGWGPQFAAVQTGLDRAVHLTLLDPRDALDKPVRDAFLAEASAKAAVSNPAILAVYEAGEIDGWTYYSSERIEAPSLQLLCERKEKLTPTVILSIAQAVSEAMQYVQSHGIHFKPISPAEILLTADEATRIRNLAVPPSNPPPDNSCDIRVLGETLLQLVPNDAPLALVNILLRCDPKHPLRIEFWKPLSDALHQLAHSHSPPVPHHTEHKVKSNPLPPIAAASAAALAVGALLWFRFAPAPMDTPILPEAVPIPQGRYLVNVGTPVDLDAFSIDRTEISIRQYCRFLIWIEKHPTKAASFDHPNQPKGLSHLPADWNPATLEKAKGELPNALLPELSLPISNVSWWDAFAFANWAGRDLPFEIEWEAAARGSKGLRYPWGDAPSPNKANTKPSDPTKKTSPGDVTSQTDSSPFAVIGLAGNVSEWTSTQAENQSFLIKGGNFESPLSKLDASTPESADSRKPSIGFRTVLRQPQKPSK